MKQYQKMQEDMGALEEELNAREYEATAGGGMVTVTVLGSHEIKGIKIDPQVVDPDDVEMLEDLIIAAANEAIKTAKDASDAEMGKVTSGLNIPELF